MGFHRWLRLALSLFLVLSINFLLPRLMPGDPVLMVLGPEAVALSQKDYASLKEEYGLHQPLLKQYLDYWIDTASGRLGYSYHQRRPVTQLIKEHLGRTLIWTLPAFFISMLGSAFFGTMAGWKPGTIVDIALTTMAVILFAMPSFLLGMMALNLFGMHLDWLPSGGLFPTTEEIPRGVGRFFQVLKHLVLPVTVLALTSSAAKFLVMRNAVVALRQDPHVFFVRARGLSKLRVLLVHVFYNACLPMLHLSALHLGFVISGAVLVEVVFSINGMGSLMLQGALHRDYPVLQGCFLVLALVVMALNVLIDWLSHCVDPRIRR